MTKIMRTLWDESAELTDEAMASETIEGGNQEADDFNEKNDVP